MNIQEFRQLREALDRFEVSYDVTIEGQKGAFVAPATGEDVTEVFEAAFRDLDRWQECGFPNCSDGEIMEDSLSAVGVHGGLIAVGLCPVCGGSGLLPNQARLEAAAKAGYFDYTGNDPEMMDKDDLREWLSVAEAMKETP